VAAVYPILAWTWLPGGKRICVNLRLYVLIAVLAAPWYTYKFVDVHSGRDVDNTPILLRDAHEGRDVTARLTHAGDMITDAATPLGGGLLLVAVAASLQDKQMRWLLAIFIVPIGLLWAVAFSYDLRNLAMLAPMVGAADGTGLMRIISRLEGSAGWAERGASRHEITRIAGTRSDRPILQRLRLWHVASVVIPLLLTIMLRIPDNTLLSLQRSQLHQVGIPSLNDRLYVFSRAHPGRSLIANDYLALRWLPEFGPRSIACASDDLATFRRSFDRADVRYVLVRSEGIAAEVRGFLAQPRMARLLFEEHGYALYEKVTPSA